jgi:hypothetical protein
MGHLVYFYPAHIHAHSNINTDSHSLPDLDLFKRKLSPHLIGISLLIPNKVNTLMGNRSLSPPLEPRRLLQQSRQLSTNKAMFRLCKAKNAKEE